MIKTNCKKFNTAREYFEESIRICRTKEFWDAVGNKIFNDAQEMIEIALKRLEECGHVYIQGLDGMKENIGYGYLTYFSCEIDNTPRATKKEIAKLARLNELAEIFQERRNNAKTLDERRSYFIELFRVSKLVRNLINKYDWRDEMFHENGLVGLRNANGEIMVPCGDYNFIHGCDYWDDTSFAIASRNGSYGLVYAVFYPVLHKIVHFLCNRLAKMKKML